MQTDKKMCRSWFGWILARAWETQHSLVKEYAVILKKEKSFFALPHAREFGSARNMDDSWRMK